jgi:hypothetical protein
VATADSRFVLSALALALGVSSFGPACTGGLGQTSRVAVSLDHGGQPLDDDAEFQARFLDIVRGVQSSGWRPVLVQPSRGRLGLLARYTDTSVAEYGPYRIAIDCSSRRECAITPIGARVEWFEQRWHLPQKMAEELSALGEVVEAHAGWSATSRAPP